METDIPVITLDGTQEWIKNGKLHRENDLPAVIKPDGSKEWWVNNKLHRENDLPAIEESDGNKEWWIQHKLHRENDLPAIIRANGNKEWWVNGRKHRENDLPAVEESDGTREWWVNGVISYDHPKNSSSKIVKVQTVDEFLKSVSIFSDFCNQENLEWFVNFIKTGKKLSNGSLGSVYDNDEYKNIIVKSQDTCDTIYQRIKKLMCFASKTGKIIFRIPDTLSKKDILLCSNHISECLIPVVLKENISPYTPAFVNIYKTAISNDKTIMYSSMELLSRINNNFNFEDIVSLLIQCLQGLSVAQLVGKFVHYDLHHGNIMIREFEDNYSLLSYELPDGRYLYHLVKKEYVIIDYGFSRIETKNHIIKPMFEEREDYHDSFSENPYYDIFSLIGITNNKYIKQVFTDSDAEKLKNIYEMLVFEFMTSPQYNIKKDNSWRPNINKMNNSENRMCDATEMFQKFIYNILPHFYNINLKTESPESILSFLLKNKYATSDKLHDIKEGYYKHININVVKSKVYPQPFNSKILKSTFSRYNLNQWTENNIEECIKIDTYTNRSHIDGKIRNSIIQGVTNILPENLKTGDFLNQNITVATINFSTRRDYNFRIDCCGIDLKKYFNNNIQSGIVINGSYFDNFTTLPYGTYKNNKRLSFRLPLPKIFLKYYGVIGISKNNKKLLIHYNESDNVDVINREANNLCSEFIMSGPILVNNGKVVFTEEIMKQEKNGENYLFLSRNPKSREERQNFFSDGIKNVNKIIPGELYHAANPNSRSAIAIRGDNVYFITVGKDEENGVKSVGMDLSQLADYCKNVLNAEYAINLDGGESSKICWKSPNNDYVNITGNNKEKSYLVGNVISFVKN